MKIACLSGKGGAGKTFTAVNLARTAGNATYIDCDVEEPNGHLFFKAEPEHTSVVGKLLPVFDMDKCNACRKCADFCHFHAIMFIKNKPRLFDEICHSCGGCSLVCPESAISEELKPIGRLDIGHSEGIKTVSGILNTGEASGVPVISAALKEASGFTVIDCPPGSSCSVMESIADADYCIIVVEPTAFGFHNFKMVYELCTLLNKSCGVVINKADAEYAPLEAFCRDNELSVLARIPYDPELAGIISRGEPAVTKLEYVRNIFEDILVKLGGVRT